MSRRIADLLIKIGADSYEFRQKAQQVERNMEGLQKKLTSVGKTLSVAITAPLTALGAVALKNADTQQQAEMRLLTALRGCGDVQQRLSAQAGELQSRSVLGDEVIIGQQAYLASLGMTEEQIGRVIEASAQLSAATGITLDSAVKNLAKTYGGLTGELGESIPKLKELTTEQLKNGEAVDFILENYKGFAEGAASAGLGSMRQLQNTWGDFLEQIGDAMMPLATKITKMLSGIVAWLQSLSPEAKRVIVAVAGIAAALGPLSLALGGILKMMPMLAAGFTALLSPIGLAVTAVLALGAAFLYAKQRKQEMLDDMTTGFEGLTMGTLESRLKENKRRQAVNERESPWQGNSPYSKLVYALNKGDRRKELKMEQQALEEAIRRKNAAYAEQERAEAEAARISEQMAEVLKGVNTETQRGGGLINDLTTRIERLQKQKLLPTATIEDIAACNAEIERLQAELQRLQKITPADLAPVVKQPSIITPEMEISFPKPKLKLDDIKIAASEYSQQMQAVWTSVREGIYGWASDSSTLLQKNVADTVEIVENYTQALTNKGVSFSVALEHVSQTVAATMQLFDEQVSAFLADSIVAAAEALGQVIAGDLGFGGLLKAILTQFASFLRNIGAQLIEFGVMIIAFKTALKSVLANPWAAIGVGAAMVAAAAIMTALINKNAKESVPALATGGLAYGKTLALVGDNPNAVADPEVIAPLSKLQAMLPASGASQNIQITLGGQLTAKGRDLVYVLGKENFKTAILGG